MFTQVKKPLFLICLMLAMFIGPGIATIAPCAAPGSIAVADTLDDLNDQLDLLLNILLEQLNNEITQLFDDLQNCTENCDDLEEQINDLQCLADVAAEALCE